jgi:hypothetical protein
MFNKKLLLFPTVVVLVVCFSFVSVSAAQGDAPKCYTLASLNGNYATVGTYGDNVALAIGVRYYDGKGNFTATFIVNQPDPASTTGGRKITMGSHVGTYTVNCDGTGVVHKTTSNGVQSVDDFVITKATVKDGQLIATAIDDAQETPSSIVPGGVFLIRHFTRRPDGGRSDGDQNQQ